MLSRMAVKVVNIGKGLVAASTPATKVSYHWKSIIANKNMFKFVFSILILSGFGQKFKSLVPSVGC